jgi:hypothetical protein
MILEQNRSGFGRMFHKKFHNPEKLSAALAGLFQFNPLFYLGLLNGGRYRD